MREPHQHEWEQVSWRESPPEPAHKDFVQSALAGSTKEDGKLSFHREAARTALRSEGNFYSGLKAGKMPADFNFFVIDLKQGRIYEIFSSF